MSTESFPDNTGSVDRDLLQNLAQERFGLLSLTPLQRFVMANTLEGVPQLVVMPTGGGKSVCFQLPALLLDGVTLVIVPLLSLMHDQTRSLKKAGIECELLKGGQDQVARAEAFRRLKARTSRIVFATPEILSNDTIRDRLKDAGIGHFVIDEAHCVSEWGKSFRPSYRKLAGCLDALGRPLVSAFTATATPEIITDIRELIFKGGPVTIVNEIPDRANIFYRVMPALSKNALLSKLGLELEKPMVIFVRSRESAELTARLLRRRLRTEEVFFYHAGLTREERKKVEGWFFESKTGILCSTSAYGMGIDKPDIRTIIHRDVPFSVEAYVQEAGRAGRDGTPSQAVLICGFEDDVFARKASSTLLRSRYELIYRYARSETVCRRRFLLNALGHELIECAGCDVCNREYNSAKKGEAEILKVIKKSPRRFTKRELVALLAGRHSYETREHDLGSRFGFGILRSWEPEDIEEALEILETDGKIRAPRRGFFKYRYRLGKEKGRTTKTQINTDKKGRKRRKETTKSRKEKKEEKGNTD